MRKAAVAAVLAAVAAFTTACDADLRTNTNNTAVTFTIQAYNQLTADRAVPLITVTADIQGFAPWIAATATPAPYRFAVDSIKFPAVAHDVTVTAELTEPNPNVVLKCTWAAMTPHGQQLSRDTVSSEGESHSGNPVTCRYHA